jgi:hypothetical protein
MAFLTNVRTELATKPAPFMASFSSRGPNIIEESILKVCLLFFYLFYYYYYHSICAFVCLAL